jgi:hypothetical protein
MEKDDKSLAATKKLQDATRTLMAARYGPEEPYRVEVVLEFQDTIADFEEKGADGTILLEISRLVPHAVFSFLEISVSGKVWGFQFDHVLQVKLRQIQESGLSRVLPRFPSQEGYSWLRRASIRSSLVRFDHGQF